MGFYPANSRAEDVIIYGDESRQEEVSIFHFLRQQGKHQKADELETRAQRVRGY